MKINRGENTPRIIQGSAEFSQSSTSFREREGRVFVGIRMYKNSLLLFNWPLSEATFRKEKCARLPSFVSNRHRENSYIIAVLDETSL